MLRKLNQEDHVGLMAFLSDEPALNLFIIGDVESFGYEESYQELWGDYLEGDLVGVLLRYRESFVPYFKDANLVDLEGMKKIVLSYEDPKILNGAKRVVDHFQGLLPDHLVKQMYFCEIKALSSLKEKISAAYQVKRATPLDAYKISELLGLIEEFSGSTTSADTLIHKIETKTGRVFYIENDKQEVIAVAQSTAENSMSAMIVGVATHPDYRRRGLTTTCMSVLCKEILEEGRSLCLFYDNPAAGKIYHDLGFEDIDFWTIIKPV